jgi:hypothetical protein
MCRDAREPRQGKIRDLRPGAERKIMRIRAVGDLQSDTLFAVLQASPTDTDRASLVTRP